MDYMSSSIKRMSKKIKEKGISFPVYGSPQITPKYKKYCWTEDWVGDLPSIKPEGCIYILEKYYDIFQYILGRLREKNIKFVLFPIERYGEVAGEPVLQEVNGRISDGTNFLMNEEHEVWAVCVKQYVNNIYDLMVLGHEVGHLYYGHKVKQEAGVDYIKVDYRYEYDADMFAINVLSYFGYLYDEQYLKLKEQYQIEFLVDTKVLPKEFYKKYQEIFHTYDREANGLLSDRISEILSKHQIQGSDIVSMLPQIIKGKGE